MWNMRDILFPKHFARSVDFLPPLTLQDRYKKNEKYLYISGTVSGVDTNLERIVDKKTSLGGKFTKVKNAINTFKYDLGDCDIDLNNTPYTTKDVKKDLEEQGMDNPELIIQERVIVTKNPDIDLEILEPLETANNIIIYQRNAGYNPSEINKKLEIPVWRIKQNLIKPQLMVEGLWSKALSAKIRGILSTKSILLDDSEAQSSLNAQNVYTLQQFVVKEEWYRDVAIPLLGNAVVDTSKFGVSLYQLDKYDDSSRDRRALIVLP